MRSFGRNSSRGIRSSRRTIASARPRSTSDVAVLDALDLADDDLADAVLELVVLALALGLAHPLHDHLLGALRGDPAEVDRRQRVQDMVADLGRRVAHLRVLDPDLRGVVLDRVGDLELAIEPDARRSGGRSRPRSRARAVLAARRRLVRPAPWPPAPRRRRCPSPAPPPRRRAAPLRAPRLEPMSIVRRSLPSTSALAGGRLLSNASAASAWPS